MSAITPQFDTLRRFIEQSGRSGVSADPLPDLRAQIMNLPCSPVPPFPFASGQLGPEQLRAYKIGHRDARHAAAELASQHQVKKGEPS